MNLGEIELSVFQALNKHDVKYLVIGGCAMRFFGMDRDIADVDLLVDHSAANAQQLCDALRELGETPRLPDELREPNKQVKLRRYDFDILTPNVDLVDFSAAFVRRLQAIEDGVPITMMSAPDLLALKGHVFQTHRRRVKKERADIAHLKNYLDRTQESSRPLLHDTSFAQNTYLISARHLIKCKEDFRSPDSYFSPIPYFLLCRAIELAIKSRHLRLKRREDVKDEFGHCIFEAYSALDKNDRPLTLSQVKVLRQASPIYAGKGFEYLDPDDAMTGYKRFPRLAVLEEIAKKLVTP